MQGWRIHFPLVILWIQGGLHKIAMLTLLTFLGFSRRALKSASPPTLSVPSIQETIFPTYSGASSIVGYAKMS